MLKGFLKAIIHVSCASYKNCQSAIALQTKWMRIGLSLCYEIQRSSQRKKLSFLLPGFLSEVPTENCEVLIYLSSLLLLFRNLLQEIALLSFFQKTVSS